MVDYIPNNAIMRFLLVVLFSCTWILVFGQRQFAVVCNTQTNTAEVIISGEAQPHHQIVRDNFPNQRAAEAYLRENTSTIQCGPKPQQPQGPPPIAAPPASQATPPKPASPGGIRLGATPYDRVFRLGFAMSRAFNLTKIYGSNVTQSSQAFGYDVGFDLTFGRTMKGGVGLHYTNLFGAFEEILLDEELDIAQFYGSLTAFKGEVVLRAPFQIGKHSWGILDFGFGYYFAVDLAIEKEDAEILIPMINDGFYGLRWGLGFDIHRFIMQLDGELVFGISDDIDKALFLMRFGIGYAF